MTSDTKDLAVQFVEREKAALVEIERNPSPLAANEVEGRTLVSLISAGTEVVGLYSAHLHSITEKSYPQRPGYASILEVAAVGDAVEGIRAGDLVFISGRHQSWQRVNAAGAVRVPAGLAPETALFARMAKVSMPTFVHTRVRPPEKCLVMGLGVVGLMAAQIAQIYGYETAACEPDADRRDLARAHGVRRVLDVEPSADPAWNKQVGLGVECSGHEQATLDLCDLARPRGDVFLVGVPWVARTELRAQRLLHSVFYNYVYLHSGWEGRMPSPPEPHSGSHHLGAALEWLAAGRLRAEASLYKKVSPENPQGVYQDILHRRLETPTALFDWSAVG